MPTHDTPLNRFVRQVRARHRALEKAAEAAKEVTTGEPMWDVKLGAALVDLENTPTTADLVNIAALSVLADPGGDLGVF